MGFCLIGVPEAGGDDNTRSSSRVLFGGSNDVGKASRYVEVDVRDESGPFQVTTPRGRMTCCTDPRSIKAELRRCCTRCQLSTITSSGERY